MSDFLGRLAARAVGTAPALRPRPRALFEPDAIAGAEPLEVEEEREAPPAPRARPSAAPPEAPEPITRAAEPPPAAEPEAPPAPRARPERHAVERTAQAPQREAPPAPRPQRATAAPPVVVEQRREVVAPPPPPAAPPRREPRPRPPARELAATSVVRRAPDEPAETLVTPPLPESLPLRSQAIARARSLAPPPAPAPQPGAAPVRDAPPRPAPEPVVEVTIGRLEVRAATPGQPARPAPTVERAEPLSLDRYVRERARGTRP